MMLQIKQENDNQNTKGVIVQKLNGRLHYLGWSHRPWKLITDEGGGEVDIWPIVESFFVLLAGERASHHEDKESYDLFADPESEDRFMYEPGKKILLEGVDRVGWSNVQAHLDNSLIRLTGRMVEIEIDEAVWV